MNHLKMQTSETFLLSAILSMSGGLQDSYTYCLRGNVFANAQTGNVVLMSQHFLTGLWREGLHYLLPLTAFALGILTAEQIGHKYKEARIHWRQLILMIEALILFLVGFIPPAYHMAANILVSFVCAMQVQSFRKVHGYGYASTMCIGNLRSGTESLSIFLRERDRAFLHKALHYYGIILVFALGAGLGGILSGLLGLKTIWVSCLLLIVGCLMMQRRMSSF